MSAKRKYTEDEIVTLVKDKSTEAFRAVFDNYSAPLYGVIFKIIPDEELAQDILHDAMLKIWTGFSSYDAAKGRLLTWMLNIARNMALDVMQTKRVKADGINQTVDTTANDTNAQSNLPAYIDQLALKEVLKKFRPDNVALIDVTYFQGCNQQEISTRFNIPLNTLKTRVRTALNQLREILIVR